MVTSQGPDRPVETNHGRGTVGTCYRTLVLADGYAVPMISLHGYDCLTEKIEGFRGWRKGYIRANFPAGGLEELIIFYQHLKNQALSHKLNFSPIPPHQIPHHTKPRRQNKTKHKNVVPTPNQNGLPRLPQRRTHGVPHLHTPI
jgi:hypothetical protein